jgi:leader peptidase (prepilin peptidase)/N-methyltransferase
MQFGEFFSAQYFGFHLIMVFIFGLLFGSFNNVCIYRLPGRRSIILPNSYCYSCGSLIRWYDNIPLLSYVILRGRCRDCGVAISFRYFVVELLTGIIFVLVFYQYRYSWATLAYLAFACFLIIATFTDFDHWIIPDSITVGGLVFALAIAGASLLVRNSFLIKLAGPFDPPIFAYPVLNALFGAFVGFMLLLAVALIGAALFKREAMGGGDVKLFAFIGATLGWLNCLLVLALSSFIGAIVGTSLILSHRLLHGEARQAGAGAAVEDREPSQEPGERDAEFDIASQKEEQALKRILSEAFGRAKQRIGYHPIPFGPYIALGSLIVLLWHSAIEAFLVRFFALY